MPTCYPRVTRRSRDGHLVGSVACMSSDAGNETWHGCVASTASAGSTCPTSRPTRSTMFRRWLDETVAAGLHEPNAMVVVDGRRRTGGRRRGWCCSRASTSGASCSSPTSAPARPTRSRPTRAVALLFPWHDLQRQVRVEGTASRVSARGERGLLRQPAPRVAARGVGLAAVAGGGVPRPPSTRGTAGCWRGSPTPTPYPCRRSGAASGSRRSRSSSGRAARAGMHDRLRYRRADDRAAWTWSGWRRRTRTARSHAERGMPVVSELLTHVSTCE